MYTPNSIDLERENLSSMITPPNISLIFYPKPIRSAKPFLNQFSDSSDSLVEKRKILTSMLDSEKNVYTENTNTDIIDMILKYKIKNIKNNKNKTPERFRYLSDEKRNIQLEAEHSIIKFMRDNWFLNNKIE